MKREHNTDIVLPSGYRKLEYIESTQSPNGYATQYINTGININGSLTVYVDVEATAHSKNNDGFGLFGCRTATLTSDGYNFVCCTNYINTSSAYNMSLCDYNRTRTQVSTPSTQGGIDLSGERHTYEMTPTNFLFDGVVKHTYTQNDFSFDKPMLFFDYYSGNARRNTAYVGKMFDCYMMLNGELIRDFVPALRLSDSKPGLYDLIGNDFYANAGTGEFLYQ